MVGSTLNGTLYIKLISRAISWLLPCPCDFALLCCATLIMLTYTNLFYFPTTQLGLLGNNPPNAYLTEKCHIKGIMSEAHICITGDIWSKNIKLMGHMSCQKGVALMMLNIFGCMNTNNAHLSNQINVTVQFPENQQFC
jgi:hypothetical protein